jgi:hypothetical protein
MQKELQRNWLTAEDAGIENFYVSAVRVISLHTLAC